MVFCWFPQPLSKSKVAILVELKELKKHQDKYVNFGLQITTLDSGLNIAPGINIATGTFGKNIKRSP